MSTFDQHKAMISLLDIHCGELSKRIKKLEDHKNRQIDENRKLSKRTDISLSLYDELGGEIKELSRRLDSVHGRLNKKDTDIKGLRDDLSNLDLHNNHHHKENANLILRVESLEHLDHSNSRIKEIDSFCKSLDDAVYKNISRLDEKISELTERLDRQDDINRTIAETARDCDKALEDRIDKVVEGVNVNFESIQKFIDDSNAINQDDENPHNCHDGSLRATCHACEGKGVSISILDLQYCICGHAHHRHESKHVFYDPLAGWGEGKCDLCTCRKYECKVVSCQ